MSDEITIDGQPFISSKRASELSGYTQDYIGQLSRSGQIQARRVGGLWYVLIESLSKYKEQADVYTPEPPARVLGGDPESVLSFDGKGYISTAKAAKVTGYTSDYVGQLARSGSLPARQVGNRWYVERERILRHKAEKDALLGAVQAESVGLKRREANKELLSGSYAGAGPFFEYTNDEGDLMPSVKREYGLMSGETQEDTRETQEGEIDDQETEYAVPIHVLEQEKPKNRSRMSEVGFHYSDTDFEPVRTSGKTIHSLVLPVVMTIVIVLSVSVVSLKNSSVYARNNDRKGEAIQTAAVGSALKSEIATDSKVKMLFDEVALRLERLLAPEVVFQRGK